MSVGGVPALLISAIDAVVLSPFDDHGIDYIRCGPRETGALITAPCVRWLVCRRWEVLLHPSR